MDTAEEECFRDRSLAIWMELASAEPAVLCDSDATDYRTQTSGSMIGETATRADQPVYS